MSFKKLLISAGALLFLGLLPLGMALPRPALAAAPYNPLDKACSQSGAGESTTCANKDGKDNAITGNDNVIVRVTRIVATAAGVVAVIVIIVYGLQLIFSYGDASKATTARNAVLAATVGLVIIVVAQSIVVFLVRNI